MDVSPIVVNIFKAISSNFLTGIMTEYVAYPMIAMFLLYVFGKGFKAATTIEKNRFDSALKNILLMLINGFINALLLYKLTEALQKGIETTFPVLTVVFWTEVPIVITFICAFIVADFIGYLSHRLLHTRPLWGTHAIHHSDRHMTWTTSYRIHLFEGMFMILCTSVTLGLLGLPPSVVAMSGFVMSAHNKYVHSQLGWAHGPLRKWIISPNFHRWHHADDVEAYNKNFGQFFVFWDRMFGSYYDPGFCDVELGLEDGPESLIDMFIYPLRYWRDEYGPKRKTVKPAVQLP